MTAELRLHLVTDERLSADRLAAVVDASVTGGATIVQLRDKGASARELIALARLLSGVVDGRALFVIDDRLDVALAARDAGIRVDGVHLGQSDVPPETARRHLGPDAVIGWTANTQTHLAAAAALPTGTLDYLGVGVIRATATKADHPAPLGAAGFARLAAATSLPCVAIGGIVAADAGELRRSGAAGLAVVSAVSMAADPLAATSEFMHAWGSVEVVA